MLNDPVVVSFAGVEHIALAITISDEGREHCGFVYLVDDTPPVWVHLAWHNRLQQEEPSSDCFWANQPTLIEADKRVLSLIVRRVVEYPQDIPYALNHVGLGIDEDGRLTGVLPGLGFTCATFVLAILTSHGFELVDSLTWPLGVNDDWQQWVVETLQNPRSGASQEHIEGVQTQVGSRRIRPSEVVGAWCQEVVPVNYDEATLAAGEIIREVAELKAARAA